MRHIFWLDHDCAGTSQDGGKSSCAVTELYISIRLDSQAGCCAKSIAQPRLGCKPSTLLWRKKAVRWLQDSGSPSSHTQHSEGGGIDWLLHSVVLTAIGPLKNLRLSHDNGAQGTIRDGRFSTVAALRYTRGDRSFKSPS